MYKKKGIMDVKICNKLLNSLLRDMFVLEFQLIKSFVCLSLYYKIFAKSQWYHGVIYIKIIHNILIE